MVGNSKQPWSFAAVLFAQLLLTSFTCSIGSQAYYNSSADLNTTWDSAIQTRSYEDGSTVRIMLLSENFSLSFALGLVSHGSSESFLLSIFIAQTENYSLIKDQYAGFPQVVWSANRETPVTENTTLKLTQQGDLILLNGDGTIAWSTNTSGKLVTTLKLTEAGNLVLFNNISGIVWQSFDHPTDTVLLGQTLEGKMLTANISATNSSSGSFHLTVNGSSLSAFVDFGMMSQKYYSGNNEATFNGVLLSQDPRLGQTIKPNESFIRLEWDGHLRLYKWLHDDEIWRPTEKLNIHDCGYPTICGNYGICSNGKCSCPQGAEGDTNSFAPLNPRRYDEGCVATTPVSCHSTEDHRLLPLANISYFVYVQIADILGTDEKSCKEACLMDCSCKGAFFKFGANASKGDCYLPSNIFSLRENQIDDSGYNSSSFLKVQVSNKTEVSVQSLKASGWQPGILISSLGPFAALLLAGICIVVVMRRMKRKAEKDEGDGYLSNIQGMLTRFTYKELKEATENFSRMLGEGGFGSVFEGTLGDGSKVAVKCLDGKGQGMKEFVAEVETIGSLHHVNLVRLVGYCAEKLQRVLVYEYMCNGSLDRWIFSRHPNSPLDWPTKFKIILHVAKGLSYLHEDCRHRIAHLDIKPQNILLDENFNAKISDFGLSKLIGRDQSQVVTTLRGTPGYLAPEWLNSVITEKVDIYSFGVVVLETMCGRKNLDPSRTQDKIHLVNLLKVMAEENRLFDIVDSDYMDMNYSKEVMKMLRIAVWCLQGDYTRRPAMSVVVKVLEGTMDVEPILDFDFLAPAALMHQEETDMRCSIAPMASIVSGAR